MSVLCRKDTLVVLPTGFGKTLVCQVLSRLINKLRIVRDPVPAIVPAHTTIVVLVSPRIALMEDQMSRMRRVGIKPGRWHTGLSQEDTDKFSKGVLSDRNIKMLKPVLSCDEVSFHLKGTCMFEIVFFSRPKEQNTQIAGIMIMSKLCHEQLTVARHVHRVTSENRSKPPADWFHRPYNFQDGRQFSKALFTKVEQIEVMRAWVRG